MYQIKRPYAPWHKFHYTINDGETVRYQIRRSGTKKYRQFENKNEEILYFIGMTTLYTINHEILAQIIDDGKKIKTIFGDFILTHTDHSQRNYILKCHNQTIAQIQKIRHLTNEQITIELINVREQDLEFLVALIILIDSFNQTIQNPSYYFPIPYRPM